PASATALLSITVPFVITTKVLPQGTVGIPYSFTLMASGGTQPYFWCIVELGGACDNGAGALPPGLSLGQNTGVISGTPTATATASLTIRAQDSSSPPITATTLLNLLINPAITNAALTGTYVFTFSGYNNGKLVLMAGSFVADGN